MTHLPDSDLRELEGLVEKATPGPWKIGIDDTGGEWSGWPSIDAPPDEDATVIHRAGFGHEYWPEWSQRQATANAALIVAAVNALPSLIADLRAAKAEIERLEKNNAQ